MYNYRLFGRKNRSWVTYPAKGDNSKVIVQADDAIGEFDRQTGKGRLSKKGSYFHHLSFAQPFDFPADFCKLAIENQPKSGDNIGGVMIIA